MVQSKHRCPYQKKIVQNGTQHSCLNHDDKTTSKGKGCNGQLDGTAGHGIDDTDNFLEGMVRHSGG